MTSPNDICQILGAGRFDLSDEKACQTEMHDWLMARLPDASIDREPRLTHRDRPDFIVGTTVIEVKMNAAQPKDVLRQLTRYAEHDQVEAVILASNRAITLPASLCGKPVFSVSLGRAWL